MGEVRLPGRRVLVVEDEAATALMIEKTLVESGYTVVGPVATVRGALSLLENEAIDRAILDLDLADGKVGPVAEVLIKRGIRFVITTGHEPSRIEVSYGQIPAIAKVFDLNELLDKLEDTVDRSHDRRDSPPSSY